MLRTHTFPHPNPHRAYMSTFDWISTLSHSPLHVHENDKIQSKVDI